MATENKLNGLGAMILDLQKMRSSIDAAIGNLTAALSASGAMVPTDESLSAGISPANTFDSQPTELPRGAFLGMSLPAAVKLFLTAMRKKQTIREIATALREGGIESTSPNFEGVVTGCLHRMKSRGELLSFKDGGWSLAEFYPEGLRARLTQEGTAKRTQAKKKKTAKAKKAAKASAEVSPKVELRKAAPTGEGLEHRIEKFAQSQKDWFKSSDIAQAMPDVEAKSLPLAMGRLAKKHGWEKSGDGSYRAVSPHVM